MSIKYLTSGLVLLSLILIQPFTYAEDERQNTGTGIVDTGTGVVGSGSSTLTIEEDFFVPKIQSFSSFQALSAPTTGLVLSWDFDGDANDSSGNGNHGNPHNISYETLENGNKIADFNGNNSYYTIPYANNIAGNDNMTISTHVYLRGGGSQMIAAKGSGSSPNSYSLFYNGATQKIRFGIRDSTESFPAHGLMHTDNIFPQDNWYHVVGRVTNKKVEIFVNGVLQSTSNYSNSSYGDTATNSINWTNNTRAIEVGRNNFPGFESYLDGKMSGLKFYNSALTDSEINDLYQEGQEKILGILPEPVPIPINLTQSFIAPETTIEDIQPIDIGASIGKFQSGSGIIFGAEIESDTPMDYTLRVEVYPVGSTLPLTFGESIFQGSGSGEVLISDLSAGEYYWTAQVIDNNTNNFSDIKQFGENIFLNSDFEIFEGFEPYPFGYSFGNSFADPSYLNGGVNYGTSSTPFIIGGNRSRIEGAKWDIFDLAFDTSGLTELQKITAFEALGLNQNIPSRLSGGTCYGMVISAAMKKDGNRYLQDHYGVLDNEINTGGSVYSINEPFNVNGKWGDDLSIEGDEDILNSILAIHLSQYGDFSHANDTLGLANNPQGILEEIRDNPDNNYVIYFQMSTNSGIGRHIVTPYRVEGNRIYVWDPNTPYTKITPLNPINRPYNQYLEVNNNEWLSDTYIADGWTGFDIINLVKVEDAYGNGNKPTIPGYNIDDTLLTYSGKGDLLVIDSEGNVSGFQNGTIINEISGVDIIIPYNVIIGEEVPENTWKQIYLSQKRNDLTIEVSGITDESYDLMIAGGDYYTKLEGVFTSSGQIDTFTTTATNLQIDFDDSKIGNYNLLVDNFQDSGTGTIYVDSVEVISEPQQYTIDWEKVVQDADDALVYETDLDSDGIYDTTISVPAIITGEQLIEQEALESTYIYPSKTISYNSGQQRSVSSWYSIVPNFDEYNWGEDIQFTTSGEGNPTVNTSNLGRQSNGVLQSGANIQMDVPPVGESYTAYLHIGEYTLEYTVSRDPAPAANVGTLDFGTKTVNYGGTATSNWVSFPFLSEDTEFTLTGEGNPTAQTVNGQRADTGTVRWGTNIKAEIPEPGQTRTIEFEILGQTGTFTIIRQ